jgi:hypothetical protein
MDNSTYALMGATVVSCLLASQVGSAPPGDSGRNNYNYSPSSTYTTIDENPIPPITYKFMEEKQKPIKEKIYTISEKQLEDIQNIMYGLIDELKEKHREFFRNSDDYCIELYIQNADILHTYDKIVRDIFNKLRQKD